MGESKKVKYLIIGGGAAAAQGAVGIREIDKSGSVLIAGKESWWPYDRPPLSKTMLMFKSEPADAESKDPSWYEKNDVEVIRGSEAVSLDSSARQVTFADASVVEYEKLLIATGAAPKPLTVKGGDLANVHLFRRADDSLAVREAFKESKSIILIGAGYIGMEVAAAALQSGLQATIVDPNEFPWSKNTSPITGKFLKEYFESKGAKFFLKDEISEILGENRVEGAVTKSGQRIEADLLVAGTGVTLNTDLAKSAGMEIDEKNGIVVDETLRALDPDIYVAGDVAAFQDINVGRRWHAEHYMNARWQGKHAGKNMTGQSESYDQVPYFFSDLLDLHMVLRGDPQGGKSATVLGSVNDADFIELYSRVDGTLAMGIAFSKDEKKLDPISDKLEELYRAKALVSEITEESFKAAG